MLEKGTLYLVPTPIGNLEDMTFRAIQTLKEADTILAEDTRNTQKLLNHFEISTKQLSFHKYNTQERLPEILERLKDGETFAEVSDAGMPVISDPGNALVKACVDENIHVVPLPGANAGLTGLIASGLSAERFTFIGFLPRKQKERLEVLTPYQNARETLIFYESPHRLRESLKACLTVFGDRKASVARELTKLHEEIKTASLSRLIAYYDENPKIKGEICFYISGNDHPQSEEEHLQERLDRLPLEEQVNFWMEKEDLSSKEAIKKVAKLTQKTKQEVYKAYHLRKE